MDKDNKLDLDNVIQSHKYIIQPVMEEHEDDAKLRRKKEWYVFIAFLFAVSTLFVVCIVLIFMRPSSQNTAINTLVGLVSALAGYYVSKK